ncbi:MAG: MFS transporter [Lachnospiraceae bacterium]|nr:MFS transporter [Lachnospiraceae bacterium]
MKSLNTAYAAVQGTYWMGFCVYTSYAAAYLQAVPYSNTELGLIMALGNLLSVVLAPALSARIDRDARVTPAKIIPVLLALQVCAYAALLCVPYRHPVSASAFVACMAFSITVNPMNVKLYVDFAHRGDTIDFGFARGFGSLAYVLLSVFLGRLIGETGVKILPVAGLVLTGLQFATHANLCRYLPDGNGTAGRRVTEQAQGLPMRRFLSAHPRYVRLLAGIMLLFFAHNILINFMINIVENLGGNTTDMGYLNAFMAAVEIPVIMFFSKWFGKYDARRILTIAFLVFTVKEIAIAFVPSIPLLYASFLLQAPSFALYTAAIVPYVDRNIPYSDGAKAQSLAASMSTAGAIFASIVGGFLYDHTSVFHTMLFACAVSAAGSVVAFSGLTRKTGTGLSG